MTQNYLLLTISALITLGGIAPAVTLALMTEQSLRKLHPGSRLILTASAILLLGGTFWLLLFEWDGILGNLTIPEKITNALFMSSSLRTAGFNTVNISGLGIPSYIAMLILMFIGGSPGGTAGGIKTTTLAITVLTFRAALRGESQVYYDCRRISESNIIQAVAIIFSAFLVLLLTVIMLVTTQSAGVKELVFEAVSALATVGLSMDCTNLLDTTGQIIVMLAMFSGRVGPLTVFLLLSDRHSAKRPGYPTINVPLA